MVRFTIYDGEKTVSFEGNMHLAYCFVAACADTQALLEDLLVAVEPYAAGTAERAVHGLLDFDRAREAAAWPPNPLPAVFEVVDDSTERLSQTPDDEGLMTINLVLYSIGGRLVSSMPVTPRGLVSLDTPGAAGQKVAYALRDSWTVNVETQAPRALGAPTHV